ncbi:MAG TPA: Appr-1-p processing protein [Nannocystis exedens]|nr:Appr-1-p processing protein [Nannocystis exedens]
MIRSTQGDILKAEAEALVNTVNCVGFMGRGIAAQFKRAYPDNFAVYRATCERDELRPGQMLVVETGLLTNPRYIINFPTKRHWRAKSRIEDIDSGLVALVKEVQERGIPSIAIPALGCGLGGLRWSEVRPRIAAAFAELPEVDIMLFEPAGAPKASAMVRSTAIPKMTPGRAVLVKLIHRYLVGLMEPFISLLEVHKLLYFAQEAGEPLRLRYRKAAFGPYAENLRHVLAHVEGHLLSGYADGGERPNKLLSLLPGAVAEAEKFLATQPNTCARFDRVAELVEGFETPFGVELLATVHWVATREHASHSEAAVKRVYAWNKRKQSFSPRHIHLAWEVLARKQWIEARPS